MPRYRQVTDIAWLVLSMLSGAYIGMYVNVPGGSIWRLTPEIQVQRDTGTILTGAFAGALLYLFIRDWLRRKPH